MAWWGCGHAELVLGRTYSLRTPYDQVDVSKKGNQYGSSWCGSDVLKDTP